MSVAIGIPHPSSTLAAGVEGHVDQRRDDHPAERGQRWQGDRTTVAQLAYDELALDLHPDDEEEDRHQHVVHDMREILFEDVRRRPRRRIGRRPERVVAGLPWRVRPHERDDRRRDEQDAAGGFDMQEPREPPRGAGGLVGEDVAAVLDEERVVVALVGVFRVVLRVRCSVGDLLL